MSIILKFHYIFIFHILSPPSASDPHPYTSLCSTCVYNLEISWYFFSFHPPQPPSTSNPHPTWVCIQHLSIILKFLYIFHILYSFSPLPIFIWPAPPPESVFNMCLWFWNFLIFLSFHPPQSPSTSHPHHNLSLCSTCVFNFEIPLYFSYFIFFLTPHLHLTPPPPESVFNMCLWF